MKNCVSPKCEKPSFKVMMPTLGLRRESKSSLRSDGKFMMCSHGGAHRTHPGLLYLQTHPKAVVRMGAVKT